jgi:2-dehydro-3-deoxy-D-arabinonate dehydratase
MEYVVSGRSRPSLIEKSTKISPKNEIEHIKITLILSCPEGIGYLYYMKLFNTRKGHLLEDAGNYYRLPDQPWEQLVDQIDLHHHLQTLRRDADMLSPVEADALIDSQLLAPIGPRQEVWAAGVTWLRSRDARMEESAASGGATFYDKVYDAERPELFFKSQPHRVAAHGEDVYIRRDSTWNVPEPELALFINSRGGISGYTIGNDMSSRSIEGENPLYLPQAKVYERSAALGPCLFVPRSPLAPMTKISMVILRGGKRVYSGEVAISQIKRKLSELAEWLFRGLHFEAGCFLMTGACLVIGTLQNTVRYYELARPV